jgi:hypothetical protein
MRAKSDLYSTPVVLDLLRGITFFTWCEWQVTRAVVQPWWNDDEALSTRYENRSRPHFPKHLMSSVRRFFEMIKFFRSKALYLGFLTRGSAAVAMWFASVRLRHISAQDGSYYITWLGKLGLHGNSIGRHLPICQNAWSWRLPAEYGAYSYGSCDAANKSSTSPSCVHWYGAWSTAGFDSEGM